MLFRQRVKPVTHVVWVLNFVQDRIRVHEICDFPEKPREERNFQMAHVVLEDLKKGSRSITGTLINAKETGVALSVYPVCVSCANESIPSPRHRAKTAPPEQLIRFPYVVPHL